MHFLLRAGYLGAAHLASSLAALAPAGEGKVARSLAARRGLLERWERWGATHRDPSRPLVWMHAPSVGEGLQARPVLEALRAMHPGWQLAYTHFSPSAASFASRLAVDHADYLPFDTPGNARRMLQALRPSVLVFSKLDLWPMLCAEAARSGVPYALVSGTVSAASRRVGIAAALTRDAYRGLAAVGAVSAEDADRLAGLGAPRERSEVTGDTRYDQVWERATRADRSSGLLRDLADERPTLVAGSTWPADEAVLLEAWEGVRRATQARLVIAPHEPTTAHCAPIVAWARRAGLSLTRVRDPGAGSADVVLVDTVGMLGDLYALATVAYVGGGFHAAGLHSVLEPAAFGAPVVFGPRHDNARDAAILASAGGGSAIAEARTMEQQLLTWLGPAGREAGARARAVVQSGLGAAGRATALVTRLVGRT